MSTLRDPITTIEGANEAQTELQTGKDVWMLGRRASGGGLGQQQQQILHRLWRDSEIEVISPDSPEEEHAGR